MAGVMDVHGKVRAGPKVIHRHRLGSHVFRRVSELVFAQGRAKALLGWIDLGGVRTPVDMYYYDAITTPRFDAMSEDVSRARWS